MSKFSFRLNILIISLLLFAPPFTYGNKHLIVGVYDNVPLVYKNTDGKYAGLSIEVLEYIASIEGWQLEYRHGSWPECLSRLKDGETDLQVLIGYTQERDKIYDYTEEAIFVAWGQVYTKPDVHFNNILDLKGKNIALYKDSLLSTAFKDLLQKFEIKSNLIEVEDYKAIVNEIKTGRADAGVFNRTFASQYSQKSDLHKTPIVFSPTPIFYAVTEGKHKDVIAAIDKHLAGMKDDHNSIYYQSIEKSFGNMKGNLIPKWVMWVFIVGAGAFLIIGLISLLLKRQVKLKTKELLSQNILLEKEIVERKQSAKALQSSEVKYRELFELSPIGLALCTMEGRMISVNPAYADIIGYSIEETLKLTYWEITPDKYSEDETQLLDQLNKTGRYGPYEKEYLHKDGHLVSVRLNGMAVVRDEEKLIWSSVEDITAIKNAEKETHKLLNQLRQSHKMEAIGTLAGGIAHDFNNLLAVILGYADMSLDDLPEDNPAKENMEQILLAANRATELVSHILTFSRKGDKERFPVQSHLLVEEALKLLRASIPTTIEIKQSIDQRCGNILADPTQIQQVVMNLCTNAAQAMDENGGVLEIEMIPVRLNLDEKSIELKLKPGDYVCLSIKDNGTGIDKKHIEKIFDPYFTTKGIGKGSGMGLAVVIGIIKSHDGTIIVDSKPGKGTTFKVYFPKIEKKVQHIVENNKPIPIGQEKILVVDDEENIVKMSKMMIERLGYKVTTKSSSIEALELFKSQPDAFDLVITDYTMPEMTGEQLSKKVLEIRQDIPIIISTGYSSKMDLEKAGSLGISAFIMKPIIKKELAKTIRKVLDTKTPREKA